MAHIKAYRDPQISLFQAAVSEVVEKHSGAQIMSAGRLGVPLRPTTEDPMMEAISAYVDGAVGSQPRVAPGAPITLGIIDGAKHCANMALKLGEAIGKAILTGNKADEQRYRDQLSKFTECDPRWAEAAAVYADYFVAQQNSIPYISVKEISDPTIPLPPKAKIVIVGDWGTGQPAARLVLEEIRDKKPDIVIHLGDIYYAGTQYEFDNYFTGVWKQVFGSGPNAPGGPSVYTLSGNHDMYSGGRAYYALLRTIGQPASFFCLQNSDWQFVAMDTGLHDCNPLGKAPTMLDPDEADWVKEKVLQAETRKTIFLSHHQLYSTFEQIGDSWINQSLLNQLGPALPHISMWIWGHEHNLVVYRKYSNVLGRCAGHGAFPVGIDEPQAEPNSEIPIENVHLDKGQSFYRHGFILIELNGNQARFSYFQDNAPDAPTYTEQV
jgi:predicted phosphodiesterase